MKLNCMLLFGLIKTKSRFSRTIDDVLSQRDVERELATGLMQSFVRFYIKLDFYN